MFAVYSRQVVLVDCMGFNLFLAIEITADFAFVCLLEVYWTHDLGL